MTVNPREVFERNKRREPARRRKASYVGVPAIFALDLACHHLIEAFGRESGGCYLVGSALERPDFRDVDIVFILDDKAFAALFPTVFRPSGNVAYFEGDPRWQILTVVLSRWLSEQVGLPVDFKFQPQTFANARHDGPRHPLGMRYAPEASQ